MEMKETASDISDEVGIGGPSFRAQRISVILKRQHRRP